MSLLVICKFLGLFANTSTADGKCFLHNSENLSHPIHMQLCKKQKFFSEFFAAFLKYRLNFEHFETKDDLHILYISQFMDWKKCG